MKRRYRIRLKDSKWYVPEYQEPSGEYRTWNIFPDGRGIPLELDCFFSDNLKEAESFIRKHHKVWLKDRKQYNKENKVVKEFEL
jgi:hypothetical protein